MVHRYKVNGRKVFDTMAEAKAYAESIFQRTGYIVEIRRIRARGESARRVLYKNIEANPPQGADPREWAAHWTR